MTIDGKVFAINRARAEARHAHQTSDLRQEIGTSRAENAALRVENVALRAENVYMRQLLSEAEKEAKATEGSDAIVLPLSWLDQVKALLRGRPTRTKKGRR